MLQRHVPIGVPVGVVSAVLADKALPLLDRKRGHARILKGPTKIEYEQDQTADRFSTQPAWQ